MGQNSSVFHLVQANLKTAELQLGAQQAIRWLCPPSCVKACSPTVLRPSMEPRQAPCDLKCVAAPGLHQCKRMALGP